MTATNPSHIHPKMDRLAKPRGNPSSHKTRLRTFRQLGHCAPCSLSVVSIFLVSCSPSSKETDPKYITNTILSGQNGTTFSGAFSTYDRRLCNPDGPKRVLWIGRSNVPFSFRFLGLAPTSSGYYPEVFDAVSENLKTLDVFQNIPGFKYGRSNSFWKRNGKVTYYDLTYGVVSALGAPQYAYSPGCNGPVELAYGSSMSAYFNYPRPTNGKCTIGNLRSFIKITISDNSYNSSLSQECS